MGRPISLTSTSPSQREPVLVSSDSIQGVNAGAVGTTIVKLKDGSEYWVREDVRTVERLWLDACDG